MHTTTKRTLDPVGEARQDTTMFRFPAYYLGRPTQWYVDAVPRPHVLDVTHPAELREP